MATNKVKTRPQFKGKDPLAQGNRLHNVSNSSDAKTYKASQNEVGSTRVKGVGGEPVQQTAPAHKTKNESKDEQAAVAKGRKEK